MANVNSKILIPLVVIVVIVLLSLVYLNSQEPEVDYSSGTTHVEPTSTRVDDCVPKMTLIKLVDGSKYMVHDGEDLGIIKGAVTTGDPWVISDDHIAFVNPEGHIIYDGEDLGRGGYMYPQPILSGDHIAIVRGEPEEGYGFPLHVIYDGEDLGPIHINGPGELPRLSGGHIAFIGVVDGEKHVIYDGEDLGETIRGVPVISGDHIAFVNSESHIVYDGEDLGRGISPSLSGDHIAFVRRFESSDDAIIYDGENLGKGGLPILYKDHIAFFRETEDGQMHLVYDGEDLGNASTVYLALAGEHVLFIRDVGPLGHLIYDGEDLGPQRNWDFSGDHIVLYEDRHIIYDGEDLGVGYGVSLSGNHVAFIRDWQVILDGENTGIEAALEVVLSGCDKGEMVIRGP